MSKIRKKNIDYLFEELWPMMHHAQEHKDNCIKLFDKIEAIFGRHKPKDHDELLWELESLPGIGITIASGLIWSGYKSRRVPFDKYTTSYALKLKLIRTNNVWDNYLEYCQRIEAYCEAHKCDIETFVREAMQEMKDSIWLAEPE